MKNAILASAAGLAVLAVASPALAQADDMPIRPTKMLSVESAGTLPEGANLVSFSGSDFQYYRGLTDRLQIEVGTGGLSFFSPTQMSLRAQAKYDIFEAGPVTVGGGLGANTMLPGSGEVGYGGTVFAPVSFAAFPGLSLNLVPRFSYDKVAHAGLELGLAYALLPDVLAIAEDHVSDFGAIQHDVLVGSAYTGFGPRTTLAFGLLSGQGTATRPYALGFGTTLHHGF
ncbi:MAG: hypothetical protein JWM80_1039 [Cyanobacteria bacterium RYN_339]|nr:hypothetical protein [Cyanobacteria bacterium RYN_339]